MWYVNHVYSNRRWIVEAASLSHALQMVAGDTGLNEDELSGSKLNFVRRIAVL